MGEFGLGVLASLVAALLVGLGAHYWRRGVVRLSNESGWRVPQTKFVRLRQILRRGPVPEVVICTDGSFIDTAIFFLVAWDASDKICEIADITLRHVEWDNLKHSFSSDENVIAYINRRHLARVDAKVEVWSNIAAFKGYALLGRPTDFDHDVVTLADANEQLRDLSRKRRLTIITNGADSIDVLNTSLTPILHTRNVDIEIHPSAESLDRFLHGHGDLFISGLPQLFSAKQAGMIEVMSSESHPLMLGIEAMVYNTDRIPVPVLEHISASWSRVCREIVCNAEYGRNKYAEWDRLAKKIGCKVCFSENDFILATSKLRSKYINFFTSRDDGAEELIRASELIMDESAALGLTSKSTRKALRELQEIYFRKPAVR
jgi:hypothetical protein